MTFLSYKMVRLKLSDLDFHSSQYRIHTRKSVKISIKSTVISFNNLKFPCSRGNNTQSILSKKYKKVDLTYKFILLTLQVKHRRTYISHSTIQFI